MNCHRAGDFLSPYLAGELAPARSQALEQHLASCDRCRDELASIRQAHAALQAVPTAAAPGGLLEEFRTRLAADPRGAVAAERPRRPGLPRVALRWPILAPASAVAAALLVAIGLHSLQRARETQTARPFARRDADQPRMAMAPPPEVPLEGGSPGSQARPSTIGQIRPTVPSPMPGADATSRPGSDNVAPRVGHAPVAPQANQERDHPLDRMEAKRQPALSLPDRRQPPKRRLILLPPGVPGPGAPEKRTRIPEASLPPAAGVAPATSGKAIPSAPRDQAAAKEESGGPASGASKRHDSSPAAPVVAQAPPPSASPTADDRRHAQTASGPQLATASVPAPAPSRDEAQRGAGAAFGWVQIVHSGALQKAAGASAPGASALSVEPASPATAPPAAGEDRLYGAREAGVPRARGGGRSATPGGSAPAVSPVLLISMRREVNLQVADVPLPELVARLEATARTAIRLDPAVPGDLRAHAELRGLLLFEALQKIGEAAELVVVPQGSTVVLRPRAAVPMVNPRQPVWSGEWGQAPQNLFTTPVPGLQKSP